MIVNLISALKSLKARYGASFVLTMAPGDVLRPARLPVLRLRARSAARTRAPASYLPVIYALRDDLTVLHVQDYNSGPIMGLDNQYHTMGGADFHIAMTDMLLAGFPVAGNTAQRVPGAARRTRSPSACPPPPAPATATSRRPRCRQAVDCLAKGTNCGVVHARSGTNPNFRGLMTWSINWDRYNAFEFSRSHRAYLNGLG